MLTRFGLGGVAALPLAALMAISPASAQESLILGTSSPGGSYFLMGGALSTAVNENLDGIDATARTTGGSVENMRLIGTGQINMGMANAAAVYNGVNATGPFEGQPAAEGVRGVATLAIAPLHWVVLADSSIATFADLAGKRVSVGKAGSGTAANAELSLELMGLLGDIDAQFLGFDESADSMRDGNTDAFAASSSIPMPAVANIATTRDVHLLSYSDAQIAQLLEANPAYQPYTIPAGSYDGVDTDTLTFGVPSTLIVNADVPEQVVYDVVMMMYSDDFKEYMRAAYKSFEPSPASGLFETIGVPLHPGAEKAYAELGLL